MLTSLERTFFEQALGFSKGILSDPKDSFGKESFGSDWRVPWIFGADWHGKRLNGKIQEIKLAGRGYRTFENFRSAILFFHGNLDLYPLK